MVSVVAVGIGVEVSGVSDVTSAGIGSVAGVADAAFGFLSFFCFFSMAVATGKPAKEENRLEPHPSPNYLSHK